MRKRSLPQPEERTERRISAATSLSICALTVIAQIVLTLALTQLLAEKISYVYFILELAGAVVAIWVYLRPGSPSYKLVWMCLLLALPVAGMILFLLWGGSHQAKSLSLRKVAPPVERESARQASAANVAHLSRRSPAWGRLASYLQSRDFLLYGGSQARYFAEGADFFDDLVLHLQRAEIYIFLEYYILAEGQIWDRIFHVLRERAAAGVEVRIIFDDFGNLTRFSDASLQALQDAGVEVEVFNPVHRYVNRIYFNYRDHRKIAVIDGVHAYTGGINIADEYANLFVRFGHWKDTGVRIDGAGAWGFASPDSDYDVRFIYVRDKESYLKLNRPRDVIELPINDVLDINGWDVDKALKLLHKSNPTVFEWFSSPVIYKTTPFADQFKPVMQHYFSSKSGLWHYLQMASGNYRDYLKRDMVKAKKYFYVLRPILACRWILEKGTPPPMLFSELAASQLPDYLEKTVAKLLDLKMNSPEVKMIPRIDILNAYMDRSIAEVRALVEQYPREITKDWEELNALFLAALEM